MGNASYAALRKVASAAQRGQELSVVPAMNPPSVLVMNCADAEHARAVVRYILAFPPSVVLDLLDLAEEEDGNDPA